MREAGEGATRRVAQRVNHRGAAFMPLQHSAGKVPGILERTIHSSREAA